MNPNLVTSFLHQIMEKRVKDFTKNQCGETGHVFQEWTREITF